MLIFVPKDADCLARSYLQGNGVCPYFPHRELKTTCFGERVGKGEGWETGFKTNTGKSVSGIMLEKLEREQESTEETLGGLCHDYAYRLSPQCSHELQGQGTG